MRTRRIPVDVAVVVTLENCCSQLDAVWDDVVPFAFDDGPEGAFFCWPGAETAAAAVCATCRAAEAA